MKETIGDRFARRRIMRCIRAAQKTKKPAGRKMYWEHAHFLATKEDYRNWEGGTDNQGRLQIFEKVSVGVRGGVKWRRHFVTRQPSVPAYDGKLMGRASYTKTPYKCVDCEAFDAQLRTIPADADGGFGSKETHRMLCDQCATEIGL